MEGVAVLRLTTFGSVGLRRLDGGAPTPDDRALPRRGLAVLALLASAEAGVSRDSLVAYLWPESDDERARNALRQTLFALRRDLGAPELVLGGADLALNPAAITSDVREFETARSAGELERAAELYAGPFLEGFHLSGAPEFERWADRQRSAYAARAAEAIESLARRAGTRGDHPAAAASWRRLVAMDPLDARVVLESMRANAAAGNVAAALRQAAAHEELLRNELGAAPDPRVVELAARLRSGNSAAPASPTTPPGAVERERFHDRLTRELAGRYEVEDAPEPGPEGGVRLYPARDLRHDRRVTLKVLHPALASQLDIERFLREIRLTGRLLHPHILPLLDSGEVAGRPWLAVPSPDGETLRARLARNGALPLDEAVRLALELADALGHAHAHGVLHRGVSPENVLLAGAGPAPHALLTNLGVARALDSAAGASLTETGMLVGSAAYMSPEQAESSAADARSDVYALGAVLFEMVTGEPLFSGPTPQAIMAKRAGTPAPGPERLRGMPAGLASVLCRALARSPGDRYGTMADLREALRGSLAPAGAGQPSRPGWRDLFRGLRRRL